MNIGLVLFPRLTQLDLTGPHEIFSRVPSARVHVVAKNLDPVESDRGLKLQPTATFLDCPALDIICVPGGPGQVDVMEDQETLNFIKQQAANAKWITSVCTGSLILGAAGLLQGYQATCHWASRDQLNLFGADPSDSRVVVDRNRVTGAGVTSGIDFALQLVALAFDERTALGIQLALEYEPTPPFWSGTPQHASAELVADARARMAVFMAKRLEASQRAAARMNETTSSASEPWLD